MVRWGPVRGLFTSQGSQRVNWTARYVCVSEYQKIQMDDDRVCYLDRSRSSISSRSIASNAFSSSIRNM